jgi:SAM-dependent methyltransferase
LKIINKFLAQPYIWDIVQFVLGNPNKKKQLYRSLLPNSGKILDFGCADGNTFIAFSDFDYYGIDTDKAFIDYAKNKYKKFDNAHWVNEDIMARPFHENTFDFVLFACTGHHIPDNQIHTILKELTYVLKQNGRLYLIDMIKEPVSDPLLVKLLLKLDQGRFVRTKDEYNEIIDRFKGQLRIINSEIGQIKGNFLPQQPLLYIAELEKI